MKEIQHSPGSAIGFQGQGAATAEVKKPVSHLPEPYGSNPWRFSRIQSIPSLGSDWRMIKIPGQPNYTERIMTDGFGKRLNGN